MLTEADDKFLSVEQVVKVYQAQEGEPQLALRDVSFSVKDGEFVSLVGPSGCGKTTLLKICAGLVQPSGGRVSFEGSGNPVPAGKYGIVFQKPALLPWRTVLDNVILPAIVLGRDLRQARERGRELLEMMQLANVTKRFPRELSGGMQQRVAIARALLHDPVMLFMDEPFGALDLLTREDMARHLQEMHLQFKKTVLFVTHSISEAVLLSDRIVVLSGSPGVVREDIAVPLSRPREVGIEVSAEFRELEARVRAGMRGRAEAVTAGDRQHVAN
jgi:NitT/TauT family transport system ATP-binding protein